jgi:hypothetical protein
VKPYILARVWESNFILSLDVYFTARFTKQKTDGKRRKPTSGIWRRVEIVFTDVSEERIASIFRVESKNKSASEPA